MTKWGDTYEKEKIRYEARRYPVKRRSEPESSGWQKSYSVTSALNLDSVIKYGFIAAAFLGVYFILIPDAFTKTKYFVCHDILGRDNCDETSAVCPTGFHSVDPCTNLSGLPLNLCQLGSWATGSKCERDEIPPPSGGYSNDIPYIPIIPGSTIFSECNPTNEFICGLNGDYWNKSTCKCEESGFEPIFGGDWGFGGGGAGGR